MDIDDKTADVFLRAWDRAFYEVWQGVLLSKFKRATPTRTGRLRRNMVAGKASDGSLHYIIAARPSGFYWRFVRGLPEKYQRIYNEQLPLMIQYAMQEARREAGL